MNKTLDRSHRTGVIGLFEGVNPLIFKLSKVVDLSLNGQMALQAMCRDVRRVDARRDIISDGDRPGCVHLILEGWACRYKVLRNGKRQLMALLLPGDFCDLHVGVLDHMDHAIGAITPVTFAYVDRAEFDDIASSRPMVQRALWWTTLVDEGILRAWLVSLGARSARERLAHLLCELRVRMGNLGMVSHDRFAMPLTQTDIGEALGLTPVHVNRVVGRLKAEGVLDIARGIVTIHAPDILARIADFDPMYLHAQSLERVP